MYNVARLQLDLNNVYDLLRLRKRTLIKNVSAFMTLGGSHLIISKSFMWVHFN